MVGYQLDDSQSLHRKLLFHHFHPFLTGCLGFQDRNDRENLEPQNEWLREILGALIRSCQPFRRGPRESDGVMFETTTYLANG